MISIFHIYIYDDGSRPMVSHGVMGIPWGSGCRHRVSHGIIMANIVNNGNHGEWYNRECNPPYGFKPMMT